MNNFNTPINSMTTTSSVQGHPASVDAYIRHGWKLVPIPQGTKGPRTPGWNKKENTLKAQADLPHGYGIGLAHAYSGTMALDVDDWDAAKELLSERGIDLDALYAAPDAVNIDSGKAGHGKMLFAMPFGLALPSKKILFERDGDQLVAYELRCATTNGLTVQDVLPPSIHPETLQPYSWAGRGRWDHLPTVPQEILDLWQSLINQDKQRTISAPGDVSASWDEIRSALETIPANIVRDDWINIGMALHWAGVHTDREHEALQIWNEWSATAEDKYPGEHGILIQWRSFKADGNGIKLGTLFHIAKQHGWKRPLPSAAEMFSAVDNTTSPIEVVSGLRPPPPDIDLSLWPDVLARRANEVADQVGCDPLVPLFAGMGALCGVVDARTRLELMDGFEVPPVLWLMTLGDPADKKSPGSRPMMTVLKDIEAEDRPRYKDELLRWEAQEAAYNAAKKSYLEYAASPEAQLGNSAMPTVPDLPQPPVPLKITVSDITSQKLVRHAAERPRGLLCYLDEMNSWVRKMTDKMSGEDRSTWVVSYESQAYEYDRVGAGSIWCENLAVSIYGNIQPTVFRQNLGHLSSDGLLQRFIPAILRGNKTKLGQPVPEMLTSKAAWDQALRTVFALPETKYKLSPEAFTEYREFQRWYEATKQDERLLNAHDAYMTAFGKLEGTAGRLILLFHLIEQPYAPVVAAATVARVVRIVKSYIIPAFRYALGEVGGMVDDSIDVWTTNHIIHLAGDQEHVSLRELKRSAKRKLANLTPWQAEQSLRDSMTMLEQCGWVVVADDSGKASHVVWAINPHLATMFKEYRVQIIKARQRQLDEIRGNVLAKGQYTERRLTKGYDPETMDP